MRILHSCLLMLAGTTLLAQNWTLINPDYKYNYSNDGTDTISNQIFVTASEVLGLDSIRYDLNPVAKFCFDCSGVSSTCNTSPGLTAGQPQVFGLRAIVTGSDWTLFGTDTMRVLSDAAPGTSWMSSSGLEGSVATASEQQVFGQSDSVKTIGFSNGSSLTISKTHGIISYMTVAEQFDLNGIQGNMNVGTHFPTILDFFNYQIGDILQYRTTMGGTDGLCIYNSVQTTKYKIMSRSEMTGRTEYNVHIVGISQTWTSPIGGGPCFGSGISSSEHQVVLGVEHDHWTEDNFLGTNFLDHAWPQAFAAPLVTGGFPGEFGSESQGIRWDAQIDDQGRYTLKTFSVLPGPFGGQAGYIPCSDDTLFWPMDEAELTNWFVEGIGFTYGRYFRFEHDAETMLEGYRIGGVEVGTITPDDIILAVADKAPVDQILLAPNPADDHLLLTSIAPGAICNILNATGQVLLTHTISSPTDHIDVSGLSPGLYILNVAGIEPRRFMIAR